MQKQTNKKSLKNFKDSKLSKKQAKEVKGAWLFTVARNPVKSTVNMICYGNVNGIENRRW